MKKRGGERRKSKRGGLINYEAPPEMESERPKTTDTLVPKADIDFLKQSFRHYDKDK